MSSLEDRLNPNNIRRLSAADVDARLERPRATPTFTGATLSDEVAERRRISDPTLMSMMVGSSTTPNATESSRRSERDWTNFLLQYGNVLTYEDIMRRDQPLSQADLLRVDMNDERVANMGIFADQRGNYYTQGMLSTGRFDVRDVELRPLNMRAARGEVISAIERASAQVGVDVDFMMRMAQQESGFNSNARAGTSSAAGLYQFLDSTWASMQRQYPELRGQSRFDPEASALAAAYFARDNARALERSLGRSVNHADLYAAHFMGLGGARTFLRNLQEDPNGIAANDMPAAARANRNIFFERDGTPRTNAQIYNEVFGSKFDRNDDWRPDAGNSSPRSAAAAAPARLGVAAPTSSASTAPIGGSEGIFNLGWRVPGLNLTL